MGTKININSFKVQICLLFMCLVELIDLVDGEGKVDRKFFGIQDFAKKIEKPLIYYYTYNFDFIQKSDIELKEEIINFIRKDKYFDLIKHNLEKVQINTIPSNVAEKIVEKYKSDLRAPLYGVNDKLIEVYKKMGFGDDSC